MEGSGFGSRGGGKAGGRRRRQTRRERAQTAPPWWPPRTVTRTTTPPRRTRTSPTTTPSLSQQSLFPSKKSRRWRKMRRNFLKRGRFASENDLPGWKERGTGDEKLLKHREKGTIRLLLRRDKTLKICADRYITPMMELKPNAGSDRAWVWNTHADFADECQKPELLALRFLNAENAQKFKTKFEECRKEIEEREKKGTGTNDSARRWPRSSSLCPCRGRARSPRSRSRSRPRRPPGSSTERLALPPLPSLLPLSVFFKALPLFYGLFYFCFVFARDFI